MKSFARKEKQPDTEVVADEPNDKESHFKRVKGSDPRAATCRGKLQHKRSKLNQDINKHLLLRQGAENLLRAAENKKVRQAVALELSFVTSNLQYLREELSDLNSSVEIYQGQDSSGTPYIPMIPFGLKETKYIDFGDAFKDFILEHYSEDAEKYIGSIQDFTDIRQAMRTPQRNQNGLALLFEYYNQLYFIERRFFPPDRSLGIHFEWYDSLTGLPSCQRTVAFEKASVLFNMAALYSQLAARQERGTQEGLDSAVDSYLRAAGIYRYILENFSNAPSRDLDADVLDVLSNLLLAQAKECLLEKLLLPQEKLDLSAQLDIGQEAAQVSETYHRLREQMAAPSVQESLPLSWQQLIHIKEVYYTALSHHHFGVGLLEHEGPLTRRVADTLQLSQRDREGQLLSVEHKVPKNTAQKEYLAKCHLHEAIVLHEEALRLYRMARELKKREMLHHVLRLGLDLSTEQYTLLQREDDFDEPVDPPVITGSSKYQLSLQAPDFSRYQVADLFRSLGPVEVFSAHHHWSAPRAVHIERRAGEGLGFSVKMEAPVVVVGVEPAGLAERVGLKEGDYIAGIDDEDLKWASHTDVVAHIRRAGSQFTLHIITPMDKTEPTPEPPRPPTLPPLSDKTWGSLSSSGVSSGVSSRKPSPASSLASQNSKGSAKRHSWNPFKKGPRSDHPELYSSNVVLR
ncbi:rhophilin-2-like isoform X1 [Amphibalanus amphitrite]|uniref:rhophilin-2-like isoform X1 n=1 Tax=Amphibalanus amphitrite TaxID=1232801 RepID=UPI001C901342|nr:rhophilin-2-like isoform X1 [Amphibalanus amphitrite]XP_043221847.1 rhophilin-2-like isoform X1 [Amphibalanus amphitrite]XP_043221849.1 rhophilin-2-like isoform X1 [Amphibalanus amphitrite]XP_043221850.1 rhophilin-2-like isoform X1 [Amphibalanus amphitrite]XP_043221851.1 rhophilin-2-like isoform X1 [Amphibalanus amphitrite]